MRKCCLGEEFFVQIPKDSLSFDEMLHTLHFLFVGERQREVLRN